MSSIENDVPASTALGGSRLNWRNLCVLALFAAVSLLNYYDRSLMAILVQGIKGDLNFSDGQIGLISGLAFSLVFALMGVPVARYSDGGRRVTVLAVSILVWTAATAACGLGAGFTSLFTARVGVGLGEAGATPTLHALICEHFGRKWRATALSVTVVASGIGIMLAGTLGGWLTDRWGWRAAFWAGAAPGPILALALTALVRDRPREAHGEGAGSVGLTMLRAVAILMRRRTYVLLCLGAAVQGVGYSASTSWIPALLMRQYHLTAGEVGSSYGLAVGLSGIAGLALGGVACDFLSRRDPRWALWIPAFAYVAAFPLLEWFLFAPHLSSALMICVPMTIICFLSGSPLYGLVQMLAGPELRATAVAFFLMVLSLMGMGVGPALAGYLSDALVPMAGGNALRWALAAIAIFYLAGGLILLAGTRTLLADIPPERP